MAESLASCLGFDPAFGAMQLDEQRRPSKLKWCMVSTDSALSTWSPEQRAVARRWARTWKDAAPRLAQVRREELRRLDAYAAIAMLCGPADHRVPPYAPTPTSDLIDQQRLFAKIRRP